MHSKTLILLGLFFFSCQKEKKIIVHNCSNSIEASSDIQRTLELNINFLKENNILFEVNNDKCGFTFINGNSKDFKNGSMTDIDFYLFVKTFYGIKDGG